MESVPFLRYRVVVVAAPGHRLARRRALPAAALAAEPWLAGPAGAEPGGAIAAFFAAHRLHPAELLTFPSQTAALAEVAAGRGVALAVVHDVTAQLRRGALVALDVPGAPVDGLWYASTLGPARRTAAASALRGFVATPEALHALLSRRGGVPAGRYRPAVHVTIWS